MLRGHTPFRASQTEAVLHFYTLPSMLGCVSHGSQGSLRQASPKVPSGSCWVSKNPVPVCGVRAPTQVTASCCLGDMVRAGEGREIPTYSLEEMSIRIILQAFLLLVGQVTRREVVFFARVSITLKKKITTPQIYSGTILILVKVP